MQWFWGQQEELFAALEHYELDLLIGGIDEETLWAERVGLTRSWYEERWSVGLTPGTAHVERLEQLRVAVEPGTLAAAALAEKGALPIRTPTWRSYSGAIAAPHSYLAGRGLSIVESDFHHKRLVLAVPPGENRWLGEVAGFLHAERATLELMANEAAR